MRTIEKASGRQAGSAASGIRERKGEGGTSPFSLPDPTRPARSGVYGIRQDTMAGHARTIGVLTPCWDDDDDDARFCST